MFHVIFSRERNVEFTFFLFHKLFLPFLNPSVPFAISQFLKAEFYLAACPTAPSSVILYWCEEALPEISEGNRVSDHFCIIFSGWQCFSTEVLDGLGIHPIQSIIGINLTKISSEKQQNSDRNLKFKKLNLTLKSIHISNNIIM